MWMHMNVRTMVTYSKSMSLIPFVFILLLSPPASVITRIQYHVWNIKFSTRLPNRPWVVVFCLCSTIETRSIWSFIQGDANKWRSCEVIPYVAHSTTYVKLCESKLTLPFLRYSLCDKNINDRLTVLFVIRQFWRFPCINNWKGK